MTLTLDHAFVLIGFVGSLIGAAAIALKARSSLDTEVRLKLASLEKTDEAQGAKIEKHGERLTTVEGQIHSDRTKAQAMEVRHAAQMGRLEQTMDRMNELLSSMRVDIAAIKTTVRGDTGEIDPNKR